MKPIPTPIHTEKAFEEAIESSLLQKGGYLKGNPDDFNRELALDTKTIFAFLQESQPEAWEKSLGIHGKALESKLLQRLTKELDNRGTLDVLRNGFIDYGVRYKMAYFKPASGLNPEAERLYKLNKLTVTRQVKYSPNSEKSVDMLHCLNGLPVATVELKNRFTGQDVTNAKKQFIDDRDPKELLFQFKKRALVHFAVDTDEVYMTTKLDGLKTKYLPFNLGYNKGAGNPPNPDGYKTSYLWEYIWEKDSWMDILSRFLHLQVEEYKFEGKIFKQESILFPRHHQLDVVRKLEDDARTNGPGKNYLIEHSVGSGKSNSIAWLAYRLSSLHDKNDKRVFDSVIVVTDRLVLDQQLQNTIYQFEHKQGVVQKIDKNSNQLAEALGSGTNIIITTLQKFPFIIEKIGQIPARNYAVIVDEAHSSQSGEAAKKLKEVLTTGNLEDAARKEMEKTYTGSDTEDEIRKSMLSRGQHKNLSFFAFTATPKPKTLEVFGIKDSTGKPIPFHLYSMRQAIEEGFIMDVLKNYTTYKTFFRLSKQIEDDPKINKKKATKAIARFVSLHPHNLAQKTEIIVEHFRQVTMKKIGGKAKAMVVTASRPHVVRYKQEFDRYITEKGYSEIKTLVAFSAFKDEFGILHTESDINGFGEKELPDKFNTMEYQLLLVADKYQTGFDQPLLHTMYVDKKLSGVKAVQTLSRLNRIYPGKEDTFILDFVNDTQEILDSFQPYYEKTFLAETTDPNQLYDLKTKLEGTQVIWQSEIDAFCNVFFKKSGSRTDRDSAQLNAYIDPAVDRYKAIKKEEVQEDFKHTLTVYLRLYSFLSQIMPFQDAELEKFYAYGRLLANKLPKKGMSEKLKLNDEVALEYYRLQKISEGSITLEKGGEYELKPTTEAGTKKDKEEFAALSQIINVFNDRFGKPLTDADKLFFDQIEEELVSDETLSKQAKTNTIGNFKYGFQDVFINKLIERMEQNKEIFAKIMDDNVVAEVVKDYMLKKVYKRLNEPNGV
ncbi:Type I restriction enzyme EcoR124II R protein [Methanosarcinales archaeon]|nr:DEAD/DEAH box helicase family protein [Candidatus Methanoperedens sp.]CAG0973651.1 Type I restriction enzyme EcoR124II R protein [Methanosarcinales archaeon]